MNISRRVLAACILTSFFMGLGVSHLVRINNSHEVLEFAIAFIVVLLFFIISAQLINSQQMLKRAKNNLDEAQRLAELGSWERDLVTGKGYWSENRYRMFGLQPRKIAPSSDDFFAMLHSDDRERVRETIAEAISSGSGYETIYRLADDVNGRIFLSCGKVLSNDSGQPVSIVGTVQDVTEIDRQQQIREDLIRQKDMFINRLGHDLKTPLTPLVALLPVIRTRAADDKQRELIDICLRNVNHIKELVVKTIQLARLSSPVRPHINLADIELASAVNNLLEKMSFIIQDHGITINNLINTDILVQADIRELENIFSNLVSNAVKFSPPGSFVNIDAVVEHAQVTISVKDNGIGLSPEELSHVFDEFYKADSSRTELGSSGLGLNICKMIIKNHGGRIWAESRGKGCGTKIYFTMPTGGAK